MPIIYRSVKGSELTSDEVDGNFQFLYDEKQNNLTFDSAPTNGSSNPVTSNGIYNFVVSSISSIDFSPYLNKDGSVTLEEDLPILDTKGFIWASTSEIRDNAGVLNFTAFNEINMNSAVHFLDFALFDHGIDTRATGGTDTLDIGAINADVINIGRTGKPINILGNLIGYQPALSGTGFVKISGTTISYDNSTYLTGNQTITLSGDISGSGSTSITATIGAGKVTNAMLAGSIDFAKMDSTTSASFKSFALTGTAGNGYGELIAQSSAPSAPSTAGLRLFAGSTGNLSWMRNDGGTDTFRRTFASTLTANRTFTFQDNTYTLAGIDIAQSFTAQQTFTGSATQMASVSLLDTTYKNALDVSAANNLRLGNGFSTVKLQPSTGNQLLVSGSTLSFLNSGGSVTALTFTSGDITFGFSRLLNTSTMTGASIGISAFSHSGSITLSSTGTGGSFWATPTINATTSAPISLFNADPTAYTALAGDLYGYRSNISSGTNRYNVYSIGSADNVFAGSMRYSQTTKTQITANQNDYAIGSGRSFRMSSDASRNVTGITGGVDGREIVIFNVGSQNIVFTNEDTNSTAANRITCSTGANITVTSNGCLTLVYDATTSRWRDRSLR